MAHHGHVGRVGWRRRLHLKMIVQGQNEQGKRCDGGGGGGGVEESG